MNWDNRDLRTCREPSALPLRGLWLLTIS